MRTAETAQRCCAPKGPEAAGAHAGAAAAEKVREREALRGKRVARMAWRALERSVIAGMIDDMRIKSRTRMWMMVEDEKVVKEDVV